MRTNEERIAALHKRAAELEKDKRYRRVRIIQAVSAVACFAVVIGLAFLMPGLSEAFVAGDPQGGMSASIFSESRVLGFIVIGILAFLLGAAVTIFCFRLKRWQEDKEWKEEKEFRVEFDTDKNDIERTDHAGDDDLENDIPEDAV